MKNLELSNLDLLSFEAFNLNLNEMQTITGGGDLERREAALGVALTGITMLACAATPVGWVLCVGGILGMAYSN